MEPDGRPTLPIDGALDTIAVLVDKQQHALDAIIDLIMLYPELEAGLTIAATKLQ